MPDVICLGELLIDFANAVGALTCTKVGAIPALPTLKQAVAFWRARRGA